VQSAHTIAQIERSLVKWTGVTVTVQCITQLDFTVVMWQHFVIWLVLSTFWQWKY